MKYGELMASLHKNQPGHLYLLTGEEGYFIDKAEKKLLELLFPQGYTKDDIQVVNDGAGLSEVMNSIETMPFFTDKNVVLVRVDSLFKETGASNTTDKAGNGKKTNSLESRFHQALGNIPEYSYVIFEYRGKVDKRKKLYKIIGEHGQIMESVPVRGNDIGDWLQGKLQSINKKMDRQAYEYFMAAIGTMQAISLNYLDKEIDKLALFMGSEDNTIHLDTLLKVLAEVPEISGFAMINAISQGQVVKAVQLFRRQQANGVFFALTVGLLARQLRLWWLAKDLQERGIRGKNLANYLGQPGFLAEKTARESQRFSNATLKQALKDLSDTDYKLKTGQGDMVELEAIILKLCSN